MRREIQTVSEKKNRKKKKKMPLIISFDVKGNKQNNQTPFIFLISHIMNKMAVIIIDFFFC